MINVVKSRRVRYVGLVTHTHGIGDECIQGLMQNHEGKRPLR